MVTSLNQAVGVQGSSMNTDNIGCPLCQNGESGHYHKDRQRDYRQCVTCQLVFVTAQYQLSEADEKAVYDDHQNSPIYMGYRQFLARLADPLIERLPAQSQGLDFGCGPGPTLSVMMEEAGHRVALFDLYYANKPEVLERQYDFITATEVIEHLASPGVELARLWSLLKPKGYLGIMTKQVKDKEAFANWHYKSDATHISFFSRETFDYLGVLWGSAPLFIGADVIIFQK